MNGTVIDIPGITVSVVPVHLEDSTDLAHLLYIRDNAGNDTVIEICYGKITSITERKI